MSLYRVIPEAHPLPDDGFYLLMRSDVVVLKSQDEIFLKDFAEMLNALNAFRESFEREFTRRR